MGGSPPEPLKYLKATAGAVRRMLASRLTWTAALRNMLK